MVFSWKRDGLARLQEHIENKQLKLTVNSQEEWELVVKNSYSTVPLECTVCKQRLKATLLGFWSTGYSSGCICSTVSSLKQYESVVALVETEPFLELRCDYEWWKANMKNIYSRVPIHCRKCDFSPDTTSFCNFAYGRLQVGCRCTRKTEGKLIKFLISKYSKENVKTESRLDKLFRYDARLTFANVLIELDGIQHFQPVSKWGGVERLKQQVSTDLLKEIDAIEAGFVLIRVAQADVRRDRFDWRMYLQDEIQAAVENPCPRVVVPAHCREYTAGVYADARRGFYRPVLTT